MFITIEGPIGVGKSSLTNAIAHKYEYKTLHEIVEDNPFLERFYSNQEKWAFQTEMFFLTNRYTQLKRVKSKYLSKGVKVVSDYDIDKNLLFAKNTLSGVEFELFAGVFEEFTKSLVSADVTIFLRADIRTLKYRISLRGREFEEAMSDEYLSYLIVAYDDLIAHKQSKGDNVIIIECSDIDFVNNLEDREFVFEQIDREVDKFYD